MSVLTITYVTESPNTLIRSSRWNQNFSDILSFINNKSIDSNDNIKDSGISTASLANGAVTGVKLDVITTAGKIDGGSLTNLQNIPSLAGQIPATSLSAIYPIGSLYLTTVSTNPGVLFGFGTWIAFGSGRVIVGVDAGQIEFDTVEETGGEKTHTLITTELPSHSHTVTMADDAVPNGGTIQALQGSNSNRGTVTTSSSGSGTAHNNLQPYITAYFFKRTA